ncbi:MAG: hypothetical protein JWM14_3143 [Chitinophagaceae bacterium]|nr:hypothetical protein [Chitinophagaceae bacterium]
MLFLDLFVLMLFLLAITPSQAQYFVNGSTGFESNHKLPKGHFRYFRTGRPFGSLGESFFCPANR